jgi:hypothetical protein
MARFIACVVVGLVVGCSSTPGPSVVPDGGGSAPREPDAGVIGDASGDGDAARGDGDGGVDAAIDRGDRSCSPDGGAALRFRDVYARVIAANGCGSECHTAGSLWDDLDLSSAEVAYRSLVGVSGCDARLRVAPCRPEESTLSVVPSLREEPCGGRHTFAGGFLTTEEVAEIDEWIRSGAAW